VAAHAFSALYLVKRSLGFALDRNWRSIEAVASGVRDGLTGRFSPLRAKGRPSVLLDSPVTHP
jgi:hypothetical protein